MRVRHKRVRARTKVPLVLGREEVDGHDGEDARHEDEDDERRRHRHQRWPNKLVRRRLTFELVKRGMDEDALRPTTPAPALAKFFLYKTPLSKRVKRDSGTFDQICQTGAGRR